MNKLIINAAITGMVFNKNDNPSLPISIQEIVRDIKNCVSVGASVVHIHARDKNGEPSYKKEIYKEIISEIREYDQNVVICVSTSGRRFKSFEERSEVLFLDDPYKPDMASLTLGSFNFPKQVSINEPDMIEKLSEIMLKQKIVAEWEIFDMGMANYAKYLIKNKCCSKPYWCNLFLGSLGGIRATSRNFINLIDELPEETVWAATGVGRFQYFINSLSVVTGGHVRVGLEDNIYYDYETKELATNISLIERVVKLASVYGRDVATPKEARGMIGLGRY